MRLANLLFLIRSSHPIPSLAVATFCFLFAIGISLSPVQVLLIGFAILFQQLSIGLSNDWLDAERDKVAMRSGKPVAAGTVGLTQVRNSAFVAALIAIFLASYLGLVPLLMMLVGLAAGWAYNLGMKAHWSSVIPYAIGFGILPIFVIGTGEAFTPASAWTVAVAALLGISAHFANVLPDLIADRQTGVQALPHILGQKISAVVITSTALAASVIILTQASNLSPVIAWLGFSITLVLAGSASVLSLRADPPRIIFPLLMIASLVNVVLLMLGL